MQLLIALDRMTQLQPRVLKVQTTANQNDQKMGMPLQYCFSTLPLEFAADSFCRENVRLDELNMKKGIFYVLMTLVTNISQGLLCARKDKGITEIVVFAIAVLFFFSTCVLAHANCTQTFPNASFTKTIYSLYRLPLLGMREQTISDKSLHWNSRVCKDLERCAWYKSEGKKKQNSTRSAKNRCQIAFNFQESYVSLLIFSL